MKNKDDHRAGAPGSAPTTSPTGEDTEFTHAHFAICEVTSSRPVMGIAPGCNCDPPQPGKPHLSTCPWAIAKEEP